MILKSEFHAAFFKTITMFRCWILKSGIIIVYIISDTKYRISIGINRFTRGGIIYEM